MLIGLLADTHIPRRLKRLPDAALRALDGAEIILHAGDVDDPAALAPLEAIAPVHAVRGNLHLHELSDGGASLPAVIELQLAGRRLVLTHGYRPTLENLLLKGLEIITQALRLTNNARLNRRMVKSLVQLYPQADIIVFGHSHRALVEQVGNIVLVNPGAVCATPNEQPGVARLWLSETELRIESIPLLTGLNSRLYYFGKQTGLSKGERI